MSLENICQPSKKSGRQPRSIRDLAALMNSSRHGLEPQPNLFDGRRLPLPLPIRTSECTDAFSRKKATPCFQVLAHSFSSAQKNVYVFSITYALLAQALQAQDIYFQSLPHSGTKTPGVGGSL